MREARPGASENYTGITHVGHNIPLGERSLGENHLGVLFARTLSFQVLVQKHRYEEAEEVLLRIVQRQRCETSRQEDGGHGDRIQALWFLTKCLQLQNKIDEAITISDELWSVVQTAGGQGLGLKHKFPQLLSRNRQELLASKSRPSIDPFCDTYDPLVPGSKRQIQYRRT